jgi:hypothetical protein
MGAFDYNTADGQRDLDVIPNGTIAVVQLNIRPGDAGEDGMLRRSKDGGCEMLDCEFVVVEGPHAKRKFFNNAVLSGTTDGHAQAADITRSRLRAILESARGIKPQDVSEAAKKARVAEYRLWAEAAQRESEGTSIVLDRRLWGMAQIEQEVREEEDPWDATLAETVGTIERDEERVSSIDLLSQVLGIHVSKQRDLDYKRLSRCMRRLGWDGPRPMWIAGRTTKGYSRPHPWAGHDDDQP